jgi:hypothetical protein
MEAGYRARSDWCSQLDSVGSRAAPSASHNHKYDRGGSSGGLFPLLAGLET